MYSTTEIAVMFAIILNEMDTEVGSEFSIPQGGQYVVTVKRSVTFWSAWMKFKQKTRDETDIRMHIERFVSDPPVQPIEHGRYAIKDIVAWVKKHPTTKFTLVVRYTSREQQAKGLNSFQSNSNLS